MQQESLDVLQRAIEVVYQQQYDSLETGVPAPTKEGLRSIPIGDVTCLFRVKELVFTPEQGCLRQLTTVLNALHSAGGSCLMLLQCQGGKIELYLGVVNKQRCGNPYYLHTLREILRSGLEGNLPGTRLEEVVARSEVDAQLRKAIDSGFDSQCITAVSCVAGSPAAERPLPGIETIVDAVGKRNFSILVLADPISAGQVHEVRQGYEELSTQLSEFESVSRSIQTGQSVNTSESYSQSFSRSVNRSISMTQSHSSGSSWQAAPEIQKGKTAKLVASGLFALLTNPQNPYIPFHIASTVTNSMAKPNGSAPSGSNESETQGRQQTAGDSQSVQNQAARSEGQAVSQNLSIQYTMRDKTISGLLGQIDRYLKWLAQRESQGMFDCCAYIFSSGADTNLMVASQYQALMQTGAEASQPVHLNTWTRENGVEQVRQALLYLSHPLMQQSGPNSQLSPAMLVSSRELARQMALPQAPVVGVSVMNYAAFGREVVRRTPLRAGRVARLGCVSHMGQALSEQPVLLDLQSLCAHTFIAGTNGSGKSNVIFKLLEELRQAQIPFMVIEPAKGEYKNVFGREPDVKVYGTNARITELIRLNPFWFNETTTVREHIDRLMDVFNACWPMYAAMPKVLEDSIEDAYAGCGWNLRTSCCRGPRIFPTVRDVLRQFEKKMNDTAFSQEVKGNYIGALSTRLESLCKGIFAEIFSGADLGDAALFNQNVIIDLSRVGSMETKAMVMGLLIIRLREYRGDSAMNFPLRHVTVLEEAHNLLKKTSGAQNADSSNLVGKSVEMIANCIAEMRSYGDGFMIADQSPGLLDAAVLRNTNTKIMLRLPEGSDRELVGRTMGLTPQQTQELARLKTGMCAVYQQDWLEAVLCQADLASHREQPYTAAVEQDQTQRRQRELLHLLLSPYGAAGAPAAENADDLVANCILSGIEKRRLLRELASHQPNWMRRAEAVGELFPLDFDPEDIPLVDPDAWLEEQTRQPELLGVPQETARLIVLANLFCHAKRDPAWKPLYLRLEPPIQPESAEIRGARGLALQQLCPLAGRTAPVVEDAQVESIKARLQAGTEADRDLAALLTEYQKTGQPRQPGQLSPYTAIVWRIADGDRLWWQTWQLLEQTQTDAWDHAARELVRAHISTDTETETSVLSLLLQHRGSLASVQNFYRKWFRQQSLVRNAAFRQPNPNRSAELQ